MAPMEKVIALAQEYKEAPTGGTKAMEALRELCNQVEAMVMLAASERRVSADESWLRSATAHTPPSR